MKIVFIGTALNQLTIEEELHEISSRFHVVSLVGEHITLQNISSFTTNARANILHIADHCSKDGILLANGEILTKERLAHIARQMRVDAVFLNACDSAFLAQYLVDNNIPVVLAYTLDVIDGDAFRIASYFYQELKDHNNDLKKAYEHASPRDGSFAWISNGLHTQTLLEPLLKELISLREYVSNMTKKMDYLRRNFAEKEKRFVTMLGAFIVFVLLLNAILWSVFLNSNFAEASVQSPSEIVVLNQTIPPTQDKWMEICHVPSNKTLRINVISWKGHQKHGDYEGSCVNTDTPIPSDTTVPIGTTIPQNTQTTFPIETNTVHATNTIVPSVTNTWTVVPPTDVIIKPIATETLQPSMPTVIETQTSTSIPTSTPTSVIKFTPTWTPIPKSPC